MVVRSPTYASLWEATPEREGGGWRCLAAKEVVGGGQVEEGSWELCVLLLLP
jgi:hypothetical protein